MDELGVKMLLIALLIRWMCEMSDLKSLLRLTCWLLGSASQRATSPRLIFPTAFCMSLYVLYRPEQNNVKCAFASLHFANDYSKEANLAHCGKFNVWLFLHKLGWWVSPTG